MRFSLLASSLALILFLNACNKDDDDNTPPNAVVTGAESSVINGEEGASFEWSTNGETETATGTTILGWEGGQLLNLNYYRQVRISTNKGSLSFRANMPSGSDWSELVVNSHPLYEFPLLLEFTSDLTDPVYELILGGVDSQNASGTVTIQRNVTVGINVYELVGTIDATFYNGGTPIFVEGTFWALDVDGW